jgi:hypothetical protein
MRTPALRAVYVLPLVTAIASCASPAASPSASSQAPAATFLEPIHIAKMTGTQSPAHRIAAANAKLTYRGGPVLSNVKVVTVFWGNGVQFTDQLNSFYGGVTGSAYYDWLSEYNTPSQKIGRGTFGGSYSDTGAKTGSIQDSDIQSRLGTLLDNGSLPAADGNTLYAVHFAPGINITMSDGSASCQVFCAYHGSFSHGGKNVYYSVIPDQGGSCAGGCGGDPSMLNNTTSVSSHELVEATTDADVAQNNLAWYDDNQGEIGDICNAEQGTIAGFTVQKEWSNSQNACIVTTGSSSCTPSCGGKQCGSDGCGGSCGTCASGQTCGSDGTCQGGSTCTPNCTGKQCGDDGCGGSCGSCASGQTCGSDGTCQGGSGCTPSCDGTSCGDDGCGGTCTCANGSVCFWGYCW